MQVESVDDIVIRHVCWLVGSFVSFYVSVLRYLVRILPPAAMAGGHRVGVRRADSILGRQRCTRLVQVEPYECYFWFVL